MAYTIPPVPCTWQGITLIVIRIVDESGYTWVEHAYPGRNGVELEAMGRPARRFRGEAVFNGPTWFEDALVFVAAVEQPPLEGTTTFTHPFWGAFDGAMLEARLTHEDRRHDHARVEFLFVEGTVAPFAFEVSTTLASAAAAAEAASAAATAALAAVE